jgi:hypothetical protein
VTSSASLVRAPARLVEPNPAARAPADAAYDRYRRLFDSLRPLF